MQDRRHIVVGIAGGTGSGKTTLARSLAARLAPLRPAVLHQDSYYKDTEGLTWEQRTRRNYDHPDAFDTPLLVEHLLALKAGRSVPQPVYDFTRHERAGHVQTAAAPVIILEGILALAEPEILALLDVPVYVDAPDDIRFMRRLRRDMETRGRAREDVCRQYLDTVRPMHVRFVEPSRRHARLIVPEGGEDDLAADLLAAYALRALDVPLPQETPRP